jgi:hypothetical protein
MKVFLDISFILNIAATSLALFCALGIFDGLYFHLYKFRLHEHPESSLEHLLHTTRAFLFAPIAYLFYIENVAGYLLMFGIGLVILDLILELFDVLVEQKSRAHLGGISSHESAVHVFASSFKMASLAMILAAKPLGAFSLSSPLFLHENYPPPLQFIGTAFMIGSLMGAVFSLAIMVPSFAKAKI